MKKESRGDSEGGRKMLGFLWTGKEGSKTALIRAGFLEYFID